MNELALFAGAGGGILGGKLLGWRTVCAVELCEYARNVLLARQDDGLLEPFPVWGDVCTFDGRPWRGVVDVVSGGFPCQDISIAGKGAGITGERSGLWKEMARIIGEVRPRYVFVENSPTLTSRGLGTVLGDLASLGYDAQWGVLGAVHAGAPHKRERIWIVANSTLQCERGKHSNNSGKRAEAIRASESEWSEPLRCGSRRGDDVADAENAIEVGGRNWIGRGQRRAVNAERTGPEGALWWSTEPELGRVANGVAVGLDIHGADEAGNVARVASGVSNRVDRLRAIGNGQVPAVVRLAWSILSEDK